MGRGMHRGVQKGAAPLRFFSSPFPKGGPVQGHETAQDALLDSGFPPFAGMTEGVSLMHTRAGGVQRGVAPQRFFFFPLSQRGTEGDSSSQIKRVRLSAQFGPFLSTLVL